MSRNRTGAHAQAGTDHEGEEAAEEQQHEDGDAGGGEGGVEGSDGAPLVRQLHACLLLVQVVRQVVYHVHSQHHVDWRTESE